MSQRHDPVLDAARDCVMAVGVRRTTMSDVARRAGLSRMTVYRRHPDVRSVLSDLMTREFSRVVERAREEGSNLPTTRERAVHMAVTGPRLLAEEPLFMRIIDVDPELLLPYLVERLGGVQKIVIAGMAEVLSVRDGSVRDAPAETLAAGVELIARSFVISARAERDDDFDHWGELRAALDGYLR